MAEDVATPRINAPSLHAFQNQTVRVVGRVTQLRGEQAVIDAGGLITMFLNRDAHLIINNAVEVVGKVNSDLAVKVLVATDLGPDVDFNAANAIVDATHRHKEIFYDPAQF